VGLYFEAASFSHFLYGTQRREEFVRNFLYRKPTSGGLPTKAAYGHSAMRKTVFECV
jgi:hypothetical protein